MIVDAVLAMEWKLSGEYGLFILISFFICTLFYAIGMVRSESYEDSDYMKGTLTLFYLISLVVPLGSVFSLILMPFIYYNCFKCKKIIDSKNVKKQKKSF